MLDPRRGSGPEITRTATTTEDAPAKAIRSRKDTAGDPRPYWLDHPEILSTRAYGPDKPHGSADATAKNDTLILRALAECPEWLPGLAERHLRPQLSGCIEYRTARRGKRPKGGEYGRVALPKSVATYASGVPILVSAHRVTYLAAHGAIPYGMTLDHLCRNHACTHVAHLQVVSQRENGDRGIGPTAVNAAKDRCPECGSAFTVRADGKRRCTSCDTTCTADKEASVRDAHSALSLTRLTYRATFGESATTGRAITAAIAAGVSPAIIMQAPALEPFEIIQRHGQRQHREDAALRAYLAALSLPDELLAEIVDDMSAELAAVG